MSERVELRTIVVATLRRWWLVVPLTLFAAGAAYAVSLSITPVYRASTSVLIGGGLDDTNVSADDIDVSEHLRSRTRTWSGASRSYRASSTAWAFERPGSSCARGCTGARAGQHRADRDHGPTAPRPRRRRDRDNDGDQLVAISPTDVQDANQRFVGAAWIPDPQHRREAAPRRSLGEPGSMDAGSSRRARCCGSRSPSPRSRSRTVDGELHRPA